MKSILPIVLAAGLLLATGCEEDDPVAPDAGRLDVTVAFEPAALTLGGTIAITASAKNSTDKDVYIGTGSSSCALGALVTYEGATHPAVGDRTCTADMAHRYVRAGETWTETWSWAGEIWREGERIMLPVGSYEVAGTAYEFVGEPITVVIKEALLPSERIAMAISVDESSLAWGDTMRVTVSATNLTDVRMAVGAGSCVLHGMVGHAGDYFTMNEQRICTRDVDPRYIEPGATLSQSWDWTGEAITRSGDGPFRLDPRTYDIVGTTFSPDDTAYESEPIPVVLEHPPGSEHSLLMTIEVDDPVVIAGEVARVDVSATNVTDVPVRIDFSGCMFGALVRYEGQAHFMMYHRICPFSVGSRYIQPGETWYGTWGWSGQIRLLPEGDLFTLPPGTYETYSIAAGHYGPFTSKPVAVEIVE
ncbi:MAG: hypothetical protein GY838_17190 [bacterium]|nr:hypothetical protein [bacterium]